MVEIATRRMAKNNVQVCLDNKIGIENNSVWLKKIRGMAKTTPLILSGKRDSNPRPLAWEANALPTELFPQNLWRKDATTIPHIVCDHKYRHLFVQLYSYLPKIVFST